MFVLRPRVVVVLVLIAVGVALPDRSAHAADGAVIKAVLDTAQTGDNLLKAEAWSPYEQGFERQGQTFFCDNSADAKSQRGAAQSVVLNQVRPEPIVASAWSRAEDVGGGPDSDYSLYLDLEYADGTPLWGQTGNFRTGTHDWERRLVVVLPEKPVKRLTCYTLFRGHGGKAWFRDVELRVIRTPEGAATFDGVPVVRRKASVEGFQVRDVALGSDFVEIEREALGLKLECTRTEQDGATMLDVTLTDTTGKDRAVTLLYVIPVMRSSPQSSRHTPCAVRFSSLVLRSPSVVRGSPSVVRGSPDPAPVVRGSPDPAHPPTAGLRGELKSHAEEEKEGADGTQSVPATLRWLHDPRKAIDVEPAREYVNATQFRVGANGRLSRYPLGAVAEGERGVALGIDMARPAFYRIGYNAGTGELFLAYDLGLAPEKPAARVRFCRYAFDAAWGFRSALARYYAIFPEAFRCRTPEQGLWMPFAKISKVQGWEDFGFKFKEGNDETRWDDEHGIVTFRYTEPMTWWMTMPKEMPRTVDAAVTEARRLADGGNAWAKALLTSGYHDETGRFPARLLDTPWCNGAVWSMNSMPKIPGEATDFRNKWSPAIRESLYGPKRSADLDGEYIDSSEGYVTDELDFRRDHFAAADTPLAFSPESRKPAIFRGLVAFEYVRGIADDVHAMGKLMMANGAPTRLPWLCPMLEVLGTETDWHRGGRWMPMSDAELLYRRSMCKGKPYCFLMNTVFEEFSSELVEKYMKRSLAYGMFPGFFSHNASQGHYFSRPELYDRDRPLFKKYVPLCKRVAEAGWEPVPLARSSDERVYVERFGPRYLTVLNDSPETRTVTITLDGQPPAAARELVAARDLPCEGGKITLTLPAEEVAVLDLDGWLLP